MKTLLTAFAVAGLLAIAGCKSNKATAEAGSACAEKSAACEAKSGCEAKEAKAGGCEAKEAKSGCGDKSAKQGCEGKEAKSGCSTKEAGLMKDDGCCKGTGQRADGGKCCGTCKG
ncbi:MAG: hypothetical protein IBJ11_02655 [Phycisphaerales bacterium]|nr:hypothetical protein [Phycisphaerales bacterium]